MFTNFPFFPQQASTQAGQVDALYFFLVTVTAFFSILIATLVIVFAIRYLRRHRDEVGVPIHGSLALELLWTIIPFFIVMVMFGWGAKVFFDAYRPAAGAMEVYVVGKQWMWKIQHPTGQREINELHVPIGQPTRLVMTSEDVIHSFFVPAFRVKADVVPGRFTSLWFMPTKAGRYHLFCTEFCGTQHSGMTGWVVVQSPEEYQAWLASAPGPKAPSADGAQLFAQYACNTCHKPGPGGRGPILHGIYGTEVALADGGTAKVDDAYLRESILMPSARIVQGYEPIMPAFQGQISEEAMQQLIEYIKNPPPADAATAGTTPASRGNSR